MYKCVTKPASTYEKGVDAHKKLQFNIIAIREQVCMLYYFNYLHEPSLSIYLSIYLSLLFFPFLSAFSLSLSLFLCKQGLMHVAAHITITTWSWHRDAERTPFSPPAVGRVSCQASPRAAVHHTGYCCVQARRYPFPVQQTSKNQRERRRDTEREIEGGNVQEGKWGGRKLFTLQRYKVRKLKHYIQKK